jgi:MFS family permease
MNPALDTDSPPPVEPPGGDVEFQDTAPANWREALMALVASRSALIQLEMRAAAKTGARRAISLLTVGICLFFTWALLLAGGIAAISMSSGWPWHWIALVAAAIHLIVAVILVGIAKQPSAPAFSATRAEFQKDRAWIENIHKKPKSNA